MPDFKQLAEIVNNTMVRATTGGKRLSPEMTRLMALAMYEDYELFPAHPMDIPDPKKIGTYNQIDRSRQYTRADNGELLRSLNEAWSKIRLVESAGVRKDAEIAVLRQRVNRYRYVNIALTAIVTSACMEGAKAVLPMFLRWIGLT